MASQFTGTINVGGIQYTFDTSKLGVNYLFRNYDYFKKTFTPIAERSRIKLERITQLFIKYFRVDAFVIQDFAAITTNDKKDLITIFKAYLEQLQNNKQMSGDSIISIMINRTYYEISNILIKLEGKPEDFSKISVTCQNSKNKLIGLSDDIRKKMILEFTWLLQHPDSIRSEAGCKWADMAADLTDIRLTDMTTQLRNSTNPTTGGGNDHAMKFRMKSLLIVLIILNAAKKCNCTDDEDYQYLQKSFSAALLSLYKDIKKQYQPNYNVIEYCMKHNHIKKNKIIMPLLRLQHISNHFIGTRKEFYGIYRLKNSEKRLVAYITSQLQCISSKLDKMKSNAQRKYHGIQKTLSPILPTSLPKRKVVESSKKEYVLPSVQFVTLNGNLTIPPFEQFYRKGSESEKEQLFQVMTNFFTKEDIYMIYSQSDEIPLNLYEINCLSVDTIDSYIPIKDYDSKYIVKNHNLLELCTFVPNATYTNAELVLSIFIALKEK